MGAGFPQMPSGSNLYPPSFMPGGFSQFSNTGVPGMMGGYAYPPGSEMTRFMDSMNNHVAAVTKGPNGESVVDWAKNLAAGQGQNPQAIQSPAGTQNFGLQPQQTGQPNAKSFAANAPSGGQLVLLLLAEVLEHVLQKLKGSKCKKAQGQGDVETAFGGQNGFCAQA